MPRGVTVKAGRLAKQVTIKTPPGATSSQDGYGEPGFAPDWSAFRDSSPEAIDRMAGLLGI